MLPDLLDQIPADLEICPVTAGGTDRMSGIMSLDCYPANRECCANWDGATMLHQALQAFETDLQQENDACIDAAKTIVEAVCVLIVDGLGESSRHQGSLTHDLRRATRSTAPSKLPLISVLRAAAPPVRGHREDRLEDRQHEISANRPKYPVFLGKRGARWRHNLLFLLQYFTMWWGFFLSPCLLDFSGFVSHFSEGD